MSQQPFPPAKGGITAYLTVEGAQKVAAFYEKAFDGKIVASMPPDEKGRTMHVHLYINGASVMLSDAYPEQGHPYVAPGGYSLVLNVDSDIDAKYQRAVDAGCTATMPPSDMFWGDRYGQLKDPFGVTWAMNQPKK